LVDNSGQTIQSKILSNNNTYNIQDNKLILNNSSDTTKKCTFDLINVSPSTTINLKIPNDNGKLKINYNDYGCLVSRKTSLGSSSIGLSSWVGPTLTTGTTGSYNINNNWVTDTYTVPRNGLYHLSYHYQ